MGRKQCVLQCFPFCQLFSSYERCHPATPCVSKVETYDIGVDNIVASSNEHIADMTNDNSMNVIKSDNC